MDNNSLMIIQELESHLKRRNEIKQIFRNKNISMLDSPDQNDVYLNHNKYSEDEVSLMQQIQILMLQEQAKNSNQINQTIIQQNQQIQSLDEQVKQLHQELSNYQIEYQKMNKTNIQLKEVLEAKLQESMQESQQKNTLKLEPQQTQMRMNQQIQPQKIASTWKPNKKKNYQRLLCSTYTVHMDYLPNNSSALTNNSTQTLKRQFNSSTQNNHKNPKIYKF
ncbi:hypothetical protein ABPG72_017715 [Tetrahymena utriculariae]